MIESLFASYRTEAYGRIDSNVSFLFNLMGCDLGQVLQKSFSYRISIQWKMHAVEYGGCESGAVQFCLEKENRERKNQYNSTDICLAIEMRANDNKSNNTRKNILHFLPRHHPHSTRTNHNE